MILLVSIMGVDCTNRGITSGKGAALLTDSLAGVLPAESNGLPCLVLQSHAGGDLQAFLERFGPDQIHVAPDGMLGHLNVTRTFDVHRVLAVPIREGRPEAGMFGGHWIYSDDARFPYESPVPVYDRFEP